MLIVVFAHAGDPTAIATAAPKPTMPARTSNDAFICTPFNLRLSSSRHQLGAALVCGADQQGGEHRG